MVSAAKEFGIASQPLTAAPPAAHRRFRAFGLMRHLRQISLSRASFFSLGPCKGERVGVRGATPKPAKPSPHPRDEVPGGSPAAKCGRGGLGGAARTFANSPA